MARRRTAGWTGVTVVALSVALGMAPTGAGVSPVALAASSPPAVTAVASGPKIVTQPARAYVLRGETATFRVAAKGSGLKYQWYRNYQPYAQGLGGGPASYTPNWRAIAGATRSSYSVSGAMRLHSSRFRVVISNATGKVTSSAATLLVGNRYLTGPHLTPTRPPDKPFRPGQVAYLDEWAVSVQPTRRVAASATAERVTVKVAAYSGYITDWMYDWTKKSPSSRLSIDVVAFSPGRLEDRTLRAKLTDLTGHWSRGFTFTATITVPRGWTLDNWNVRRNGTSLVQYFSSRTG